jgi:chitinase
LRKAAKKKRLEIQSEKSSGKLSKNCESVNDFDFESNDNECIDSKNDDSDKCTEIPSIIYSDIKQMNSCRDSPIDGECEVICRSGYEPNEQKIKCEKSGNRNVWKSKHIKCSPIESNCEKVNNDENSIRIKASTKYPEEKLHYVLRYDKSKKLPQFSIYIYTKENNVKETEPTNTYNENSCKLLNGQQLTKSDYKKSDYNPKPLLPQNAFLYSKEAQTMNNYFPNTAPQDPFTSHGPWSTIENRTLEMLKSRPGIVISGVCPQTIKNEIKDKNQTLDIPECFWSIVCVPFDNGVTSAVFYAENTHPISQLEKQSRVDQIRQYRDQRFVVKLLGTDLYRNVWYETYNAFKDVNKGIKAFISKCAQTSHNTPEAIGFWDDIIKGDYSGQKWQSKFNYGLEKSDEQLKNPNKSKSLDNQNLVSGKRSVDQSVPEDRLVSDNFVDGEEAVTDKECENKIIGYITSWGNRSFTVNEGSLLTHAIYAYVHMDSKGNLGPFNAELNENKAMFKKLYEMLSVKTKLLDKNQYLKTMVSFGGWNNSDHFSSIVASPEHRNNFILDALSIIDYWNLEGIEIDWKYPVIGGSKVGQVSDRKNFVTFLRQIRQAFSAYEKEKGRTEPLLLSITGASGYWLIDESYDLENIIPLVDWINILTYDYFGPWKSKWGANTGPNAPLYASAPIDSLSKMNIHSTIEQYFCRVNSTDKLVMSIPFYGHYWNDVGEPIDTKDNHFRDAHPVGGFVTYSNIKNKWLSNRDFQQLMHNKSFTPYLWSEIKRVLLSYENSKSIESKIKYAIDHKLGGVSVWAIDFDDNENELFNTIAENYKSCSSGDDNEQSKNSFKCNSYEKKWWTNEDGPNAGLCGRSAPLINGFYPVCDPESQTMSCCSSRGRCGSGPEFCECEGCINYKTSPELMMREPLKPSQEIRWLTSDKQLNGDQNEDKPNCGYKAQQLNGSFPICNPDDNNAHCCSVNGSCGVGSQFCNCKGCVNFRKNPKFSFLKKLWWDQSDGLHRAGRCGKLAPKVNGTFAICNPYSEDAYCCGKWGFCGAGSMSCDCVSCVNFKRNPYFRWK